jgi:hypothetical protein
MEGDPLLNAERLLAGALEGRSPVDEDWLHFTRGEVADLEVGLAEIRRAAEDRDWLATLVYEFLLIGPRQRGKLSAAETERFLAIPRGGPS